MIDFLQGKWLKHPLHPALVHIPTALWPIAWLFDLFSQFRADNVFVQLAFYAGLLGLIVALLAIPTGLADWTDIGREKPAWKLGLYHLILNVVVSILWTINLWMRKESFQTDTSFPLAYSGFTFLPCCCASLVRAGEIYAMDSVADFRKRMAKDRRLRAPSARGWG